MISRLLNLAIQTVPGLPVPTDSIPNVVEEVHEDIEKLSSLSLTDLIDTLANKIIHFAFQLAIAIVVFYIGKFVIRKIYRLIETIMMRRGVDGSLTTFVLSLVNMVLFFILIVTVIGILGIETSSFIALFASAGVAIGMALSGTLQNFAGGVLILLLKPYKIGDYIETQGYAGTVTEIQIFNTIINTYDNKQIIIPNGGLSTGTINNWSRQEYRRVQWDISISYGDNVEAVRRVVLEILDGDKDIVASTIAEHRAMAAALAEEEIRREEEEQRAEHRAEEGERHSWLWRLMHRSKRRVERHRTEMNTPNTPGLAFNEELDRQPQVLLTQMADSSINLAVRAWVPTELYWEKFYKYNEMFYSELPSRAGISFPFPQLDVHLPSEA